MPDEEISHEVHLKYFSHCRAEFEDVFLRWHRRKVEEKEELNPDFTIPPEGFLQNVLQIGLREASRSPDWWLQVGAVIWKDKKILLKGFNTHLPTPRITEVFGDPRAFSSRGKNIEITTALHAEASLISAAAKFGIPLRGNSIFVTVFPCPPCAKLIANSGLRWLYYLDGYSVLDGEAVLKQADVMIVKISESAK
jgi:dCMP deaminase